MIVYMLLNTVTEKAYIGATDGTLEARWKRHLQETVAAGSSLGRALRDWPEELWLRVVLCNCYTVEELAAAERSWIQACGTLDPGIGYNQSAIMYDAGVTKEGKRSGGDVLTAAVRASSPLAGMDPEQRREYFRAAGKRGALKSATRK